MRVMIYIGHPAHVHFFKNLIWELEKREYKVIIAAIKRESTFALLNAYNFEYEGVGKERIGLLNKAVNLVKIDYHLFTLARKFRPDLVLSVGSPYAAHVAKLVNRPHIAFDDTEHSRDQFWLYAPFTDAICTPSCFERDLGAKQVRYDGYHELAYLHPNYFQPDKSVLEELDLSKNDKFFILRFVSWSASHDIGQRGIEEITRLPLINTLEDYGRVFITSESRLNRNLEEYKVNLSPDRLHNLLHYAEMYIGEGGTMASEAALLGTPSIYVNTLRLGYLNEQENKYGLVYNFSEAEGAMEKAVELLENANLKRDWQKKREALLKDKIDVTRFMVGFVTDYPESFKEYAGGKS